MYRKNLNVARLLAIGLILGLMVSGGSVFAAPGDWPVITSAIPLDQDMEDAITTLIGNMSLAEKVGQMVQPEIKSITPVEVTQYFIGSVLNGGGAWPDNNKAAPASAWVTLADSYYNASVATAQAIPIIWGTDAVHGHSNVYGATLFPHNIGLGAANDPTLIRAIGAATAKEVAVTGLDWTFAPTLAVVRDDRWGRTYEGYSEDPEIVKAYAGEMVKGLQGDPGLPTDLFNDDHVVATAKHYVGDGGTDLGMDQGDNLSSELELRDIHAQGYLTALADGAQTVMASFNSWQGDKLHGHTYLLTDILKGRFGFDGFVIGDWNGHGQLTTENSQTLVDCSNGSCAAAINAGVDMIMVPADWQAFITNTIAQVDQVDGIPMFRIDDAVRRILRVKMRSGLLGFTGSPATKLAPSTRTLADAPGVLGSTAHRTTARDAVRKSLVLLKNKNEILPLDRTARVLVAGKSADSIMNQTGGWTLTWQGTNNTNADFPGATSIWQGIDAVTTGAVLNEDGTAANTTDHDVALVVIGETPYAEGSGDIGNSQTLEHARMNPEDLAVIQTIVDAGVPVVTIFVAGRPLYVNKELNRSDAFVAAWLPGSEGGGIADVIFKNAGGATNYEFTGKLSYSWPGYERVVGAETIHGQCQTPLNRNEHTDALFDYGFGLTYADTDTLGDALPEDERTYGCGQDDPGQAGTTNTILEIFMNGVNVDNGAELGSYAMRIGGDSNGWAGLDVSTDPFTATALPDGEVSVTTENGLNLQQNAKRVVWDGATANRGQIYSQVASETPGVNLTKYQNSETSMKFRVKVNTAPTGPVTLGVHCEYPCVSTITTFGDYLATLPLETWTDVSVPLQCFIDEGLDMSKVNTPFLIVTESAGWPMDLSVEEIRWEPWTAGPTPDCSAFAQTVDVIDEPVHYVFNNGLAGGYEFANYNNPSSAIVPNPDGSGDNVWSAILTPGSNVEIKKSGVPADMSAYDVPTGTLAFDIRVSSLTATDILIKVGTNWPELSDLSLFSEVLSGQPILDTWVSVSIPIQTLLASDNSLSPGNYADINEIVDMLVLESVNGDAGIFVRNVRWLTGEDPNALIKNGTFENGTEDWGFWAGEGGNAEMGAENGELEVAVTEAGNQTWSIQVMQGPIDLVEGIFYQLSFDARATLARSIEAILENAAYERYLSEEVVLLGDDSMQHYAYQFVMDAADTVTFKFLLGNVIGSDGIAANTLGAHDVFIDNVKLEVVPEPGTFALLGAGLFVTLMLARRRTNRRK
ncbi:MAG: PEP-CTERM sorting domain-containing protein [bacterium]|nr:PEP-CTERM sorting domain-containing protein [bacterium]